MTSDPSSPVVPSVGAVPVEVPEEAVDAVMQELEPALVAVGVTLMPAVFRGRSYVGRKLIERVYPLIAARVQAEERQRLLRELAALAEGDGEQGIVGWLNAVEDSEEVRAAGSAVPVATSTEPAPRHVCTETLCPALHHAGYGHLCTTPGCVEDWCIGSQQAPAEQDGQR